MLINHVVVGNATPYIIDFIGHGLAEYLLGSDILIQRKLNGTKIFDGVTIEPKKIN